MGRSIRGKFRVLVRISTVPTHYRPLDYRPLLSFYLTTLVGGELIGTPPPFIMPSPKISLALLGLVGSALAHQSPVSRRKTMGFGPVHPHSKFHTSPIPFAKASLFAPDPYDVATSFVTTILRDQLAEVNSFVLRKGSYTDKATGVTHVFFRQMINGLEVADGDINVNVKDGAVISYGDSVSIPVRQLPPLAGRLFYNPSFTVALYQAPPSLMSRSLLALMPNFATFCKTNWSTASVLSISCPLPPTRS